MEIGFYKPQMTQIATKYLVEIGVILSYRIGII